MISSYMKILCLILTLLFSCHALTKEPILPPIKIGVYNFSPPFVTQGGKNELYGFEISMTQYICQTLKRALKRDCVLVSMPFEELLNAISAKKIDLALNTLTVTLQRLEQVNFSLPYLPSRARFLGRKDFSKPFDLATLNQSTVGIYQGSAYNLLLKSIGAFHAQLMEFQDTSSLIEALNTKKVDFILMDDFSALYWQAQSSNLLKVFGNPMTFGEGFSIAVNRENLPLLEALNKALVQYLNSPNYKKDFETYLSDFQ